MAAGASDEPVGPGFWHAYRLRWKRRRLLLRAWRAGRDLISVVDRTAEIGRADVLAFMVLRNEMRRLPWFLKHYRELGVNQFLIVDNDSTDDSAAYLAEQTDVSLWRCSASYRDARFGRDWINHLLLCYGHKHWCLVVDADELLIYAGCKTHDLHDLTAFLAQRGQEAFGALMLDMYPDRALGTPETEPQSDPIKALNHFDPGPFRAARQQPMQNLWVQGGARERMFFNEHPRRSPTLNKLPLIRWNRRWAFVNSTHSALPWRLNHVYHGPGGDAPSGALLHTKFLSDVVARSTEDMQRQQHFHNPTLFKEYYAEIAAQPVMVHAGSVRFESAEQLVKLDLMGDIPWT